MTKQLFQHQTLGDLMAGYFDGTLTIEDLLKHGDTGIGSFHAFDGELIVLDGQAYQIKSSGEVLEVEPSQKTPYAAVSFFEPDHRINLNGISSLSILRNTLTDKVKSPNVFSVFRIDGFFQYVKTRAVEKQNKPYPRIIEATKVQPEFEAYNLEGTVVGIYTPKLFDGVSIAGYHSHFISADRKFGGHVLDHQVMNARISIQTIDQLVQNFATDHQEFMESSIDYGDLASEMNQAEG
ncbi:acetolactate decarboxylase [Hutsoniella sourekii]|uniref:acetolactate decarboxylase n=1 Tax=Hutsoniella sourekii TaxID=87650 RepID=UPI000484216B|nr:acetolactate decarboxylase [Hutsoniella sourekii]